MSITSFVVIRIAKVVHIVSLMCATTCLDKEERHENETNTDALWGQWSNGTESQTLLD